MKEEKVDFSQFSWLNPPEDIDISDKGIEFITLPETDFWQRTHYGFRRNNGHAFLTRLWDDFSLTIQTEFFYESLFDQAGLLLYIDEDNWAKASLEYQDESYGQLGSVVTQAGYSDWASTTHPLAMSSRMWYRISRREQDFLFENSHDGRAWHQMRVFHMGADLAAAKVGIYACSPQNSSFKTRFSTIVAGPSKW